MQYRRLGRSGLMVSAVGFGTCQLRRVPEQQALDTLKRGFDLGVNVVHTAPDYGGADDLVAQAVAESGRDVLVLTQGYGDRAHFEWLFESACRKLGRQRLPMFGIACIDDRELLGEPVWTPGGILDFLDEKKRDGRLGSVFCTTHGPPDYVARLITSGRFDAIMLAYNALGFHLLSYHPDQSRRFEDIPRNGTDILPLAARCDVGLLVMKPLAGGLLVESKSFPPIGALAAKPALRAADVLRGILERPEVSCVVPGTASVEEAEENARAGHAVAAEPSGPRPSARVASMVDALKATLCSRCGTCDALCSQHLPVSWLFRDAYITHYPSETFETADALRYFHLHPAETAACSTCAHVTCACPSGIDIPRSLGAVHAAMLTRRAEGRLPEPAVPLPGGRPAAALAAALIAREIPGGLQHGERAVCRLYVQNTGDAAWVPPGPRRDGDGIEVELVARGAVAGLTPVRHRVEPGTRTHFVFEVAAPARGTAVALQLALRAPRRRWLGRDEVALLRWRIPVGPAPAPADVRPA